MKTLQLAKNQSEEDKSQFFIDIAELKWEDYFLNMMLGVRQYLNKETPKTLEAARKKDKMLLGLHVALQLGFFYLVWKLLMTLFGLSSAKAALILPIVYYLFSYLWTWTNNSFDLKFYEPSIFKIHFYFI